MTDRDEKGNEEFTRIEGAHGSIEACPVCGSAAELWSHSKDFATGPILKAVMCSNGDAFGPQGEEIFGGCLLYMPPSAFYQPTIREAVKYWNQYAVALRALRNLLQSPEQAGGGETPKGYTLTIEGISTPKEARDIVNDFYGEVVWQDGIAYPTGNTKAVISAPTTEGKG